MRAFADTCVTTVSRPEHPSNHLATPELASPSSLFDSSRERNVSRMSQGGGGGVGGCTATQGIRSPSLSLALYPSRSLFLSPSLFFFFLFPYNLPRRRADMHGARKVSRELPDDKREPVGLGRNGVGSERRTCVGIKSVLRERRSGKRYLATWRINVAWCRFSERDNE